MAEEMTGYAKHELIGKSFLKLKLLSPSRIPKAVQLLTWNALGRPTGPDEFVLNRKDGSQITVEIRTYPITIDGQTLILGIARNISKRAQMREKLQARTESLEELVGERTEQLSESEKRFRELADLLPQAIFEIDERANLTYANRHGLETFGYTSEELRKGLNGLRMFIPDERERAKRNIIRILSGDAVSGTEYTAMKKDGSTFPAIVYSNPIVKAGKPVGLRGIIIDLSNQKHLEHRLVKSERMAAIGETALMVGHDLRNPLQVITTNIWQAKQSKESSTSIEKKKKS